ncbi:hypothetical protein APSETT444_002425 [Aspergillus pseudonomiae]
MDRKSVVKVRRTHMVASLPSVDFFHIAGPMVRSLPDLFNIIDGVPEGTDERPVFLRTPQPRLSAGTPCGFHDFNEEFSWDRKMDSALCSLVIG